MISTLSIVTIIVDDQDEAHAFYTDQLGFETRSDETVGPGTRWLTVAPPDQSEVEILLQEPDPDQHGQKAAEEMRKQVGKNPVWSFQTEDLEATYEELRNEGITFVSEPTNRPYGKEAVFVDLYGNRFSLLETAG